MDKQILYSWKQNAEIIQKKVIVITYTNTKCAIMNIHCAGVLK